MILNKTMPPQMQGFLQRPEEEPVSRTYQYRKVMKPMLERKRRARINRCLDELKDLMVTALQAEGENVAKLEKADILELTVRHLHSLKRRGQLIAKPEVSYAERFRAGFTHCATEVSQFITSTTLAATAMHRKGPVDPHAGARLLQHLSSCIRKLESCGAGPDSIRPGQNIREPEGQRVAKVGEQYSDFRNQKRPVDSAGEAAVSHGKRQQYAPPSPPISPTSTTASCSAACSPAQSMWRPW